MAPSPLSSNTTDLLPDMSSSDLTSSVYLIDALGLVYRSYHALSQTTLSNRGMLDTRAIYGFTLVLLSLLKEHIRGSKTIVVFEGKKIPGQPDFRTELYSDYKANRPAAPTGVKEAVPWVKEIACAMGLAVFEVDRFEADDTIGTLAKLAHRRGSKAVIVSADKDFRQLLKSSAIEILRPLSKARNGNTYELITEESFRAEFANLPPARYVDVLALVGDKSDNVPGVPGIGPKSAPEIISRFGNLEALIASVQDPANKTLSGLSARQLRLLRENVEQAKMSLDLVRINDNVVLENFDLDNCRRKPVNANRVTQLVHELDFDQSSILRRMLEINNSLDDLNEIAFNSRDDDHSTTSLQSSQSDASCSPENVIFTSTSTSTSNTSKTAENLMLSHRNESLPNTQVLDRVHSSWSVPDTEVSGRVGSGIQVYTGSEANAALERALKDVKLSKRGAVGISVLSSSSFPDAVSGIALSFTSEVALFFDELSSADFRRTASWRNLQLILADPAVEKRGWHMKDTLKLLQSSVNPNLRGCFFDLRVAGDLVHGGRNLTDRALILSHMDELLTEQDLDKVLSGGRIALPQTAGEAEILAGVSMFLGRILSDELENLGLATVARDIEFPLVSVLAQMELNGVPCNSHCLDMIQDEVKHQIHSVEQSIAKIVANETISQLGEPNTRAFNASSRNDVTNLLFAHWKLPVKALTKTGKPTVDKRTLQAISEDRSISKSARTFARLMLEHRELSKVYTSYTQSLRQAVMPDGRIRATFVQDASSSGRLSTVNPNLQSVPSKSALGCRIRDSVEARPNFSIFCADYSQIEMRILAALSGDAALLSAFRASEDVHALVAQQLFSLKAAKDVTKEQRNRAKAVSYGIPYGISSFGLAKQLQIATPEASRLIKNFFAAYPGIEKFTKYLITFARKQGYARALCGRRQYLPLLARGAVAERRAAERVAVNMPIQGTQADMIKLAMVRIDHRLEKARCRSQMILQVHDELVFEVADDEKEFVESIVRHEMCTALPLPNEVEIVIKAGFGRTWLEAANSSTTCNVAV